MQSGAIRPLNNMLPRNLFNAEHEAFRETVRKFYAKEVVPNIEKYEQFKERKTNGYTIEKRFIGQTDQQFGQI